MTFIQCGPFSTLGRRQFVQLRYAHNHRTIKVQLLQDVPGLGEFGSLQEVRPGYMRNYLKPRDLANYVLRDVGPALMSRLEPEADVSPPVEEFPSFFSQITPSTPTPVLDMEKLRERLAALPPLIFSRRVREDALAGGMQPIYGSVSVSDVTKHLEDRHAILLVPPDAIVAFQGHVTKLRSIGQWTAEVRLKNGDVVPLLVQIVKQEQQ